MTAYHWIAIVIFYLGSIVTALAQSYIGQINVATSRDKDLSKQLSELYEILPSIDTTIHIDTTGLVYYFIATRHKWKNQILESKRALNKSIYSFNKANYNGFRQANNYLNRAHINKLLGFPELAIQDAESILKLPKTDKVLEVVGDAQRIIASIYRDKGDYESAISHLEYFLTSTLSDSIDAYSESTILSDLSMSYSRYSDSLSLEKSLLVNNKSTELIPQFLYPDEQEDQLLVNKMQSAYLYTKKNKIYEAINIYKDILKNIENKNTNLNQNRFYIISTANLLDLYQQTNQKNKALVILNKYDDIDISDLPDGLKYAYSILLENIAGFYNYNKQLKPAAVNLEKAFSIYRLYSDLNANSVQSNSNKHRIAKLLNEHIELDTLLFNKTGNEEYLVNAMARMHTLDTIIDYINQDLLFESSILNWREEAKQFYNAGIKLAYDLNDDSSFWRFCEKAKALALLDGISNDKYFLNQADIAEIMHQLKLLQLKEVNLLEEINSIPVHDDKTKQSQKLKENKSQQKDLLQSRDFILKKQIPQTIEIGDLLGQINKSTLIQYYLSEEHLYSIVLNNNESNIYKLTKTNHIQYLLGRYRSLLQSNIDEPNNYFEFRAVLSELYIILISSIRNKEEHLVIIPDDDLSLLPFESLISKDNEYLIKNHSVQYLLSASLQKENSNSHKINETIISAPSYSSETFSYLSEAIAEAEAVKKITKGKILGSQKKSDVIQAYTSSDVFHFSGHSEIRDISDNESYLALSDTSRISEREIYNLSNELKMVFLSACDTGLGKILKGEGVSNLTRSFMYSGAQSVIQALWKINDETSEKIVSSFYNYLKTGVKKSKALQLAKIDFLNSVEDFQRHPYYWSGLVLVGNDNSLKFPRYSSNSIFIAVLFLLAIAIFSILYLKHKRMDLVATEKN